jgi:hypothetical protein
VLKDPNKKTKIVSIENNPIKSKLEIIKMVGLNLFEIRLNIISVIVIKTR